MSEKSPYFVDPKPLTRLDVLREQLDRLESLLGGIERIGLGASALEILELLDQSDQIMRELEQNEKLPPEEAARFETIGAQFKTKANAFLHAAGGAKKLEDLRKSRNPAPESWWWWLDLWVAGESRKRGKRLAITGAILFSVLVVLGVVYQVFLAPSPQEQARFRYEAEADRMLANGNLEGALKEIDQALAVNPEDPALLIRKGVLLQSLGRDSEAGDIYSQAETKLGNRKDFLLARGQDFLSVGNSEAAMADVQALLEVDPDSPEAYLLMGQVYELTGKNQEAIQTYEKASSLAEARNLPQLTALARVRLAYLMQRSP